MQVELAQAAIADLLGRIAPEAPLALHLKSHWPGFGSATVPGQLFDAELVEALLAHYRASGESDVLFQLLALQHVRADAAAPPVHAIEALGRELVASLQRQVIDGWLYQRSPDGVWLPWLVTNVRQVVPTEGVPYVIASLLANTVRAAAHPAAGDTRQRYAGMTQAIVIDANDIQGQTVAHHLAERGFFTECTEFRQAYDRHLRNFQDLRPGFGRQYVASQAGYLAGPKGTLEYARWRGAATARCVNDEETLTRHLETFYDPAFWRQAGAPRGFDRIPVHCYLHLFDLELHRNVWVHVENLAPYRYKPQLRDKIILPKPHRDLIDILTADKQVLSGDIIEGKTGGTAILCKGAPGLGKTLTAEVYAEVVGKPLYRVHSGQLGVTAASVEASLTRIFRQAERWNAILLLDEADVYIRRRDNDLQHNAIVAEFLRTLEYFDGVLFMTTNRTEDVDDAILSRCAAVIRYEIPSSEDARKIWLLTASLLGIQLAPDLLDALLQRFPGLSGRDVKELLKLVGRFSVHKGLPLSLELFSRCAVFRGSEDTLSEVREQVLA